MRAVLPEQTYRDIDEFLRRTPQVQEKLSWAREIADQSRAEGTAQGTAQGTARGEQQALLRLLRHKFKDVPEHIARQVQATQDLAQLDDWIDRAADANALADIGFAEPGEDAPESPAE